MGMLKRVFSGRKKPMNAWAYGASDNGKEREGNEDSYLIIPERALFMVADGMGGHNAGEVASMSSVRKIRDYLSPKRILRMKEEPATIRGEMIAALKHAHEEIIDMSTKNPDYTGMGSTIVLCFISNNTLFTCHVGDSRIYVINQSGITQITIDHSTVSELVLAGKMSKEEARHSSLKNQITQAIGAPYPIDPEFNSHSLTPEDTIILCSDGLWDMLPDEEIQTIVLEGSTLDESCKKLIEMANEAGGEDNITVVLIKSKGFMQKQPIKEKGVEGAKEKIKKEEEEGVERVEKDRYQETDKIEK